MNYIPTSAHETFEVRGYSSDEARRVRGFMPRRFGDIAPALPLTNIDFWLAYECVKHYNEKSRDRGRFFAEGDVDFRSSNKISYRSRTLNETFSTTEFLRHFGDILYTNYNQALDIKVPAVNEDGSLVIKNRTSATRLTEIQKQANVDEDLSFGFGFSRSEYQVGRLHLPPTGNFTPKMILDAFFHGELAREVNILNGRRQLSQQLNFQSVATYLYILRYYNAQDRAVGDRYEYYRDDITRNLQWRTPIGYYSPELNNSCTLMHIGDDQVLSKDGIVKVSRVNIDRLLSPALYRYATPHGTVAITDMPPAVYSLISIDSWKEALSA